MDKMQSESIFVTKADKGGATLIMNFTDVKAAIENELFNTNKFTKLERNMEEQLDYVKEEVKSLTIHLQQRELISENDKTLIAGVNSNNRAKMAPEYHPESPYAYPLFKIHKLTKKDIEDKKVPPTRLVHASKFGPLYRMEKWCSPYLTEISREFCKEEFILDTSGLISKLESINESKSIVNENVNLFTIDVEKLYPSIQPELALQAIHEALEADTTTDYKTKDAIKQFIRLSFEHSYVSYQNECFKSKVGIPTGGSLSRQIADIFLHWILYIKMTPKLDLIQAIRYWGRFIDDGIGIWRGTKRSFDNFMKQLNSETSKYGIYFPPNETQFGKSVHHLDLWVYLDDENTIHYRGYTKPTDAKRYLNPRSFHPRSIFNAIPYSQMLRTMRNNSKEETRVTELTQVVSHFENSGYNTDVLSKIKEKATTRPTTDDENDEISTEGVEETLVFPVHYFEDLPEFKKLVRSLTEEFNQLIGNTRIIMATKKRTTIGNVFVRNKQMSITQNNNNNNNNNNHIPSNQQCNGRGCRQCPLSNEATRLVVNDVPLRIPRYLDCKSRHVHLLVDLQIV